MNSYQKSDYPWDHFSDQPHRIRDRALKARLRRAAWPAHLRMLGLNLVYVPRIFARYLRLSFTPETADTSRFFGLCVNINRHPAEAADLVRELGVRRVLVRLPLSEIDRLDEYEAFIRDLMPARVLVSVLQDRATIEDPERLTASMRQLFSRLSPYTRHFKIGNAVNRFKWSFYSLEEYLAFFGRVQALRDREFPDIELTGSSVIDFEIFATVRSLFHPFACRYDNVASLLYVDRRGPPETRQMHLFDLRHKIRLIKAAVTCSAKAADRLTITETNWPLADTKPWAPASGDCCVTEPEQADYLARYYLLALSTGMTETVYWHQLIAPGYGLVDSRDGLRRRAAFATFKTLIDLLQDSRPLDYQARDGVHYMDFRAGGRLIRAAWSQQPTPFPWRDFDRYQSQTGELLAQAPGQLDGRVIYCIRGE